MGEQQVEELSDWPLGPWFLRLTDPHTYGYVAESRHYLCGLRYTASLPFLSYSFFCVTQGDPCYLSTWDSASKHFQRAPDSSAKRNKLQEGWEDGPGEAGSAAQREQRAGSHHMAI